MGEMLALLLASLSIETQLSAAPRLPVAPACLERDPAVTVQIHDYEHLPSDLLSPASEIVSQLYRNSGVGIEWLGVVQQDTRRSHYTRKAEGLRSPIAQFTIIVLTPAMAARGRVADGVLGFAAVPTEGLGRIAYVIYDRVRQVAVESYATEAELLGFVMAHDIGHLILGRGAQSDTGLLRSNWDRRDLQQLDPQELEFSALEADRIRTTLRNAPAAPDYIATARSRTTDACVTTIPRRNGIASAPR